MSNINETLEQRGQNYGDFTKHAIISQCLEDIMRAHGWDKLSSDKKEALKMIVHKIARIINGDPNYKDSWVDIAGYAQLVVNNLEMLEYDLPFREVETNG